MPATRIRAEGKVVRDVFRDDYRFTIPRFQRAYGWTKDRAERLLDDLLDATLPHETPLADLDPYFLGSVVVVKSEAEADAEIIDGQQRLTTLTLLLSVARQRVSDAFAESLNDRLFQRADSIAGIVDQPRLRLRERDQRFFELNIQRPEGALAIRSVGDEQLSDSQKRLLTNAKVLLARLEGLAPEVCERLIQFVVQHTYLIMVATPDVDTAFRIFSTLNDRGMSLSMTDILKAEVIGTIPPVDQDVYSRKWEDEEDSLGQDDFQSLFAHIRTVHSRRRAQSAILGEFRSAVLAQFPDPRVFIDEVLVPYATAFHAVSRSQYGGTDRGDDINALLRWLNRQRSNDWVPAVIRYLRRTETNRISLLKFLTDFERLTASMMIRAIEHGKRETRYLQIIQAIDAGENIFRTGSPLELAGWEKAETLKRLNGDLEDSPSVRKYVLLRLDALLAAVNGTHYEDKEVTVEHVLPKSPPPQSAWLRSFSDQQRKQWLNKVANLILLTSGNNKRAANLDFDEKRDRYFDLEGGVSHFVLTTQVLSAAEWTPVFLDKRQHDLVSRLSALWRLR